MSLFKKLAMGIFTLSVLCGGNAKAEVHNLGNWGYECHHDEKDPYGTVIRKRYCAASISGKEIWRMGHLSIPIFQFTEERWGLGREMSLEGCDYTPQEIAVDGVRIDNLTDEEQINAVVHGKSLTRRLFEKPWPYCSTHDVTITLKGSAEVYKRLLEMSPKFLKRPVEP